MTRNLLAGLLLCLLYTAAPAQEGPAIAAGADLRFALDEVAQDFHERTGRAVRIAYASSGNLFAQIRRGVPFDMFLSEDEALVFELAASGLTFERDHGELYAIGRLVLFAPHGSPVKVDAAFRDVRAALHEERIKRLVIPHPLHSPDGRAARETLERIGLWEPLKAQLVLGDNDSHAAEIAASGAVDAGVFSLSLALSPTFSNAGSYVVVPHNLHQPLRHRMVLLRRAGDVAQAFYAFMRQPDSRATFKRWGFVVPED